MAEFEVKRQCTISVVMPVYNAETYLEEAIDSVLNQTFEDFEFVIIDDGSNDRSLKIIQQFSSKDDRIIYITRKNKGIIYSLNEGLNASSGLYIARMDADDISCPERLERQYKFMVENKLDICGGDYISIDQNGLVKNTHNVAKEDFEILLTMASNVPFAHPSVMMKKSFLINHKLTYGASGYKSAEDLDLWMNMYTAGAQFGNVGACILKYRMVSSSLSSINHRLIMREVNKQFDLFVNNNHENFKSALELFCLQGKYENNFQRVAIKALFRYLQVDLNFTLLYKCWRKVSLYNFIKGVLSYINSRLIIK
jgi:glycosyltransferase involved in cell wall biosynthesis